MSYWFILAWPAIGLLSLLYAATEGFRFFDLDCFDAGKPWEKARNNLIPFGRRRDYPPSLLQMMGASRLGGLIRHSVAAALLGPLLLNETPRLMDTFYKNRAKEGRCDALGRLIEPIKDRMHDGADDWYRSVMGDISKIGGRPGSNRRINGDSPSRDIENLFRR